MDKHNEQLGELIETEEKASAQISEQASQPEPDVANSGSGKKYLKKFIKPVLYLLLSSLLSVAMIYAAGWWFWQQAQEYINKQVAEQQELHSVLASVEKEREQDKAAIASVEQRSLSREKNLAEQIDKLDQRVLSQHKRIVAMSTTSREDWLLAEAEYLLRLANQRVLIERRADNAISLLVEADKILLSMADPSLLMLRAAIRDDLAALKLAEKIDAEGIYLELRSLAKKVENLALLPESFDYQKQFSPESHEPKKELSSFDTFLNSFTDYVRIIRHDEKPEMLLPPDSSAYLHLNLRMLIEQAQLALLREHQQVYSDTLLEAESWLRLYFPITPSREQYREELSRLAQQNIVPVLPDISESLQLLNNYITELHSLAEIGLKSNKASPNSAVDLAPTSAQMPNKPEDGL